MDVTLTYGSTLARVQIAASSIDGSAVTATVERSTDLIRWTTVRGGGALDATGGSISLDDYEFVPGVLNSYRVRSYSSAPALLDDETDDITPVITAVWAKSVARPYLNSPIVVRRVGDITRPARGDVHEVEGRSLPVAVSQVRGSRRWQLELRAADADVSRRLELLAASGDTLYLQVPSGSRVPGGYVHVGDVVEIGAHPVAPQRYLRWDLVEVAAPGPDVVGTTVTWQSIVSGFATWSDVLAEFATWADVLEYVASPEDVIVP